MIAGIRLQSGGPRRGSSHEGQRDMRAQRLRPRLTLLAATAAFLLPVLASQPALAAASGSSPAGEVRLTSLTVPVTGQAEAAGQDQPSPAPASTRLPGRHLPSTGFDGMLVAAVGVALTGLGWLLLLAGGRRYRRRSR